MGMDLGRGGGGRAPFLVIGLLLICIVLVFNWWSLSTQNLELYRQLEERGEHLKIGSRKNIECNQLKQELEKELSLEKQSSAEKSVEIDDLKGKLQKATEERDHNADANNHCHIELDSLKNVKLSQEAVIEARKVEKEQFDAELKDKKAEISKLQAQLKEVQEKLDQKTAQAKEVPAVPVKEETNPVNHEGRNNADVRAAADVNNARDQADDAEKVDPDNNLDDLREKEQQQMQQADINEKNTIDNPQSS